MFFFSQTFSFLFLLLRRLTWRHWKRKPWQTALQVLILGLGVALFFSMRLANKAAVASFENFSGVLTARSEFQIQPKELLEKENKKEVAQQALSPAVLKELPEVLGVLPVEIVPVVETVASRSLTEQDLPNGKLKKNGKNREEASALFSGELYQLLGVDLVALRNWSGGEALKEEGEKKEGAVFSSPKLATSSLAALNGVFITEALAKKEGLNPGDQIGLVLEDRQVQLPIAGILPQLENQPPPPERLILIDIALLQQLTGREGSFDRIEVFLPPSLKEKKKEGRSLLREKVEQRLLQAAKKRNASWVLVREKERGEAAATMTAAFRMNLTILSLLGLLVGLYLIIQSLDGAVIQRRGEIALLRSLGVTTRMIEYWWLLESAFLGVLGGILGLGLGWLGAQFAVGALSKTWSLLYYSRSVAYAGWDRGEVLVTLFIAVMASLIAGWWPARQAAKTVPAEALREEELKMGGRSSFSLPRLLMMGGGFFLLGGLLALFPAWEWSGNLFGLSVMETTISRVHFPLGGYLGTLAFILGASCWVSYLLPILGWLVKKLGDASLVMRMTATHLLYPTTRHRLAVASLMTATLLAAGMMILIASFEATMERWVEKSFQLDLYISSQAYESSSGRNHLREATWQQLIKYPAVADAQVIEQRPIFLRGQKTTLLGCDVTFLQRHQSLLWKEAPKKILNEGKGSKKKLESRFWEPLSFQEGEELQVFPAAMNESFAERFHLKVGDSFWLPTPQGRKRIELLGVFSDYGNERGVLLFDRSFLVHYFEDHDAVSLILALKSGVEVEHVMAQLKKEFPALSILSNRTLRGAILKVFHQTFAITYALELIGISVAMIGLAMTLWSILLDRKKELGLLHMLGIPRWSVVAMMAWESLLLATDGVLVGELMSLPVGAILVFVINKQSFGWTLQWVVPWKAFALLAFVLLLLAGVVGVMVGVNLTRGSPRGAKIA